jgi:DNA-binding CsgD family transcriptional regulator
VREREGEVRLSDQTSEAGEAGAAGLPSSRWFELDPRPVLIVTGDGKVLEKNPAAHKLLQEQAAASLTAGRLLFVNEDARKSFAAALTKVVTGRTGRISIVLRCDGGQWRRLHLVRDGKWVFLSFGREDAVHGDISPLVEAFRLSAAEAKVLLHLAQGLPPKWIASRLDISPHTVRAHLRNLYLKMHVNGLCDLIREYTRLTD